MRCCTATRPKQWMSDILVFPAIGLIFPFERFRKSHLDHHMDSNLTDPYDDPESNYLALNDGISLDASPESY